MSHDEIASAKISGELIHENCDNCARMLERMVEVNEALIIGAVRQHEFTEVAERLNAHLQIEIVAHKKTSRELAEKANLLDLSNDAIIVSDFDDQITLWNQGAEKLYGWFSEEVLGKDLNSLLRTEFPTPREKIALQLEHEGLFIGEVVQTTRGGRRIPLICRWVMDRKTRSILTSFTDITERHAVESALANRAVKLASANRSKDEFLAMLAHELRNPLASLSNAAAILQITDVSVDDRGHAQYIINRQIENMSRMIDDLLDVSRITEGKIELRKQPVALEAILTAATSLVRANCIFRHQDLTVSLPVEPIFLNADTTRLEQVFINLLGNACKYSGDGCSIALSAERAVGVEPPEVVICVRDNGAGIDAELLPRVFDLFVQATRALDRSHGGLGIGLTLVNRLVTLHGGSVEAHSAGLGHGSEFTVRLPILHQTPSAPLPLPAPIQETSRRILIVDDNTDSARSMAILQSRRGHVTRTAFTGPDALTAAAEFLPEVVLLDIGLPGMDGFEVARLLRRMPVMAGALLIAMTGYASAEDRHLAAQAGFDEHLIKPVDLETLRDWLRTRP
ncbi:MAG: hypothetical protein JWL59_4979 [Chthoniobacteraceae bacterium]|nr:hypothetical protein [Chthoniobacteraceae bacterium]